MNDAKFEMHPLFADLNVAGAKKLSVERSSPRSKSFLQEFWLPTLMLMPAAILYLLFFIYPTLYSVYLSFHDWNLLNGKIVFEGMSNYIEIFSDPVFIQSAANTLLYVVFTTVPLIILSLLFAVLIENCGPARGAFRTLIYVPVVISMSVAGMMWQFVLNPSIGIVNHMLSLVGIQGPNWVNDVRTALGVIIAVGIWRGLGINIVLFIAGLKGVSREQVEAAKVDGANTWQVFWNITRPAIAHVTAFVFITTIISCFQVFTTIQVMTMGGPNNSTNMLVFQVWQEAFQFFDMGRATSISTLLFILLLLLSTKVIRAMERKTNFEN